MIKFQKLKNITVNLLFPPRCIICNDIIDVLHDASSVHCVCKKCRTSYESIFSEVCSFCNQSVSSCICGVKSNKVFPLAKCFYYKPSEEKYAGNKVVYALKHTDDKRISRMLSSELSYSLREMMRSQGIDTAECIFTFVPRRRSAVSKYGFDQGRRLSKYIAAECGNKRGFKSLFKRRGNKEQKKLTAAQREKNLEKSLKLKCRSKRLVEGRIVCVVDDVVTTGATMRIAEKLLLSAGVKRVIFACVARTKNE